MRSHGNLGANHRAELRLLENIPIALGQIELVLKLISSGSFYHLLVTFCGHPSPSGFG